jgi:hypothetical protein
MRCCLASIIAALLIVASASAQTVLINELLATNDTGLTDLGGDNDDWLELYNAGSEPVELGGMYVTDDEAELTAWQIPADQPTLTVVPAGGFLVLWFDGEPEEGALHMDAKLSQNGEWVALVEGDGITVVDSVRFGAQVADVSYGRLSDGAPGWGTFSQPTPGAPNTLSGQAAIPVFTPGPGQYSGPTIMEISAGDGDTVVYYTLDGSEPTPESSPLYDRPFALTETTVIRAIAQVPGNAPGPPTTGTYLIAADYGLPVVSLITDPANLYDEESGIMVLGPGVGEDDLWPFWNANWFVHGERPAHIEYFGDEQEPGFSMDVGIELAGAWSRALPKKSFDVKMRAEYGAPDLTYPLFPDNDYDTYDGLVLRAGAEDHSRTRNEIVYMAHREIGLNVDMQAYTPVVLLLNGQYWGIYSLMERKDADFIASRYGERDIDLLADWDRVIEGSRVAYDELVDFLNDNDISTPEVYAEVRQRISVKSFVDSWVLHVYTNHGDENNTRYWRPRTPTGQWRWIAYDFDWWLDPEADTLGELAAQTRAEYYSLLGRMLANADFRAQFVNRLADFLNTVAAPDNMARLIDRAVADVGSEIDADLERWSDWVDNSGPYTLDRGDYEWQLAQVRDFVQRRPALLREQVVQTLGLSGLANVTLDSDGPGAIDIGSLELEDLPWSGTYFQDIPMRITAVPQPGYRFSGWAAGEWPTEAELIVSVNADVALTAQFATIEGALAINEISYNPSQEADAGDWVELANRSTQRVDLSGWRLIAGGGEGFALPADTWLQPGQYLVLVRDAARFHAIFPRVTNFIGDLGFGLSNGGETITLADAAGEFIDQVAYDDLDPWPTAADGQGAVLELIDPASDNAVAASWRATELHGSPGRANGDMPTAVTHIAAANLPVAFELQANYPNPFNPRTVIRYGLPTNAFTVLRVYDTLGQQVRELVRTQQEAGYYSVELDGSDLASGVYLYKLEAGSYSGSGVMALLK